MNGGSATYLFQQLAAQLPTMIVLAIAVVLAVFFLRRAFLASVLTLCGAAVLVASKLGIALLQSSLIASRQSGAHSTEEFGRLMSTVGIAGMCIHAVGLALLVAAIFVGRPRVGGVVP